MKDKFIIVARTANMRNRKSKSSEGSNCRGDLQFGLNKRSPFGGSKDMNEENRAGTSAPGTSKASTSGANKRQNQNSSPNSSPYTPDQVKRIKTMSIDEKKLVMCKKCGLLFHNVNQCPNEGRVCFWCGLPNHDYASCPKRQQSELYSCFWYVVVFLVDSCASHSIVGDKNLLFDYHEFENPVEVRTVDKDSPLFSVGEGTLPIMFTNGKNKIVVKLKMCKLSLELMIK
mgnify:CR=1 FL=1